MKRKFKLIGNAKNKLKHAKALFEIQGYSDCVTLSYYSMYLCAKALLVKKDIKIPKSHQELIKRFSLEYVHKVNLSMWFINIWLEVKF